MKKYSAYTYKQGDWRWGYSRNGCRLLIDGYHCVLRCWMVKFAEFDLRKTEITIKHRFRCTILSLRNEKYYYKLKFSPRQWRRLTRDIDFV